MTTLANKINNVKNEVKDASIAKKIAIGAGVIVGVAAVSVAATVIVKHLPKAAEVAEKVSEVAPEVVENTAEVVEAAL